MTVQEESLQTSARAFVSVDYLRQHVRKNESTVPLVIQYHKLKLM